MTRKLYSCRLQKTCATLDFPIDGIYEITNCDLLNTVYNQLVIEHQYFCANMNEIKQEVFCININDFPNDCIVNIGTTINTIYAKNKGICFNSNIIFSNVTNNITNNITNYCNTNFNNTDDLSILIMIIITISIIIGFCCLFCCCCYCVHKTAQDNYRKERMRNILNTVLE